MTNTLIDRTLKGFPLVSLLLGVLLASCGTLPKASDNNPLNELVETIRDPLGFNENGEVPRDAVFKRFPTYIEKKTGKVSYEGSEVPDTTYTVEGARFYGLGEDFFEQIEITSPQITLKCGIRVGDDLSRVKEYFRLWKGVEEEETSVVYRYQGYGLSFEFGRSGKIEAIEWWENKY